MKAYLIKASAPGPFKEYKKAMGAPPQNIFSVAAATPQDVELVLCDETIGMKPKFNVKADMVALFFHTPDAVHAYALADKFKAKDYTVVLGGLHPTFRPEEAVSHADAVMVGEAEGIWGDLLQDVQKGTLKSIYKRDEPVDLATVKPYPTNLIPPSKYSYFWSVLVSRGCVHNCEYCTVPPFFCGKYRLRPIENIVAEIKALPQGCWVELHADNLTANRAYALELFAALKPLKINWAGEATIKLADDEELLKAAAESGCKALLIGIETPSQAALSDSGKGFVDPDTIRKKIRWFHDYGISITSSMIFGFDSHTTEIFRESAEFSRHIKIDEVESVVLIPFPGTPLYKRLESENRILSRDWSLYDGANVVFQPKNMTPEALEEGSVWFWEEIQKKKPAKTTTEPSTGAPNYTATGRASGPALTTGGRKITRWKSVLALGLIGVGLLFDLYWVWGILFLIWAFNDLLNRRTHLLDDIPRSESPILYWIIVLMWLLLGIWTVSVSATPYWSQTVENKYVSFAFEPSSGKKQTNVKEDARNKNHSESVKRIKYAEKPTFNNISRLFQSERFSFMVTKPKRWNHEEQTDLHNTMFHFQDPKKEGTVTVIAIDFQEDFPLQDFISYMEDEIAKDLPFVKTSGKIERPDPLKRLGSMGIAMKFWEYKGKYQGYVVKTLVGYGVKAHHGYALMGVYSASDNCIKKIVYETMGSFKLSQNGSNPE